MPKYKLEAQWAWTDKIHTITTYQVEADWLDDAKKILLQQLKQAGSVADLMGIYVVGVSDA